MQMLRILSVPKNFVLFIRKKMEASLISKEMLPTANKKLENIQKYMVINIKALNTYIPML